MDQTKFDLEVLRESFQEAVRLKLGIQKSERNTVILALGLKPFILKDVNPNRLWQPTAWEVFCLATACGLRVDDFLNLQPDGLKRLRDAHRFPALFRLSQSLNSVSPGNLEMIRNFNSPGYLEELYAEKTSSNIRINLLITLASKIEQWEAQSPEYLEGGRAEYVLPARTATGKIAALTDGSDNFLDFELVSRALGETVQEVCSFLDLPIKTLADRAGISTAAIRDLLKSSAGIHTRISTLDGIARGVGLTIDELYFIALPQLTASRWPFFVQNHPGGYWGQARNHPVVELLLDRARLERFFVGTTIKNRVWLMLAYRQWLTAEKQNRERCTEAGASQCQPFKTHIASIFDVIEFEQICDAC
ncbi:MAG TPA: hypothetical protein VH186_15775 [Chloroflexia bacterium]|nr:hypothetical protein [Chloroflexia bacterium]